MKWKYPNNRKCNKSSMAQGQVALNLRSLWSTVNDLANYEIFYCFAPNWVTPSHLARRRPGWSRVISSYYGWRVISLFSNDIVWLFPCPQLANQFNVCRRMVGCVFGFEERPRSARCRWNPQRHTDGSWNSFSQRYCTDVYVSALSCAYSGDNVNVPFTYADTSRWQCCSIRSSTERKWHNAWPTHSCSSTRPLHLCTLTSFWCWAVCLRPTLSSAACRSSGRSSFGGSCLIGTCASFHPSFSWFSSARSSYRFWGQGRCGTLSWHRIQTSARSTGGATFCFCKIGSAITPYAWPIHITSASTCNCS